MNTLSFKTELLQGIPETLPDAKVYDFNANHAPKRKDALDPDEKVLAVTNALRYFPEEQHEILAPEFAEELLTHGRIYMHRFKPDFKMYGRPIDEIPAVSRQAAGIIHMYLNNLDPAVAQHPDELITYGGNGSVFQNWAQFRQTMQYLATMNDEQTLVLSSGHPIGLFPSHKDAPRLVIANGITVPNYSGREDFEKLCALGVAMYGQMTAGSAMYIGPQGIVHGTTITLLNAGRKIDSKASGLEGKLFVSSGLGGMSGAQAKAAVIAGGVGVIAEINSKALNKRHEQGWLDEKYTDLEALVTRIQQAKTNKEAVSLGYEGNIVDLWEYLDKKKIKVDIGSDQTSLHNPFEGGYYPAGLTLEESNQMMSEDPERFKVKVEDSLKRHVNAINKLTDGGMYFFDYGNAFLLEVSRAGADIMEGNNFKFPSYVQDIMGPMCFDYGFGPFRWVCTSAKPEDLEKTDAIASKILEDMAQEAPEEIKQQILDNLRWINEAGANNLVVGSQARILYSNHEGRTRIAEAFNEAVRKGDLSGPVVLGRDHHDVSGTDSPYRETSNLYDGSKFTADMAVQNVIGDASRGATWVSFHNGGGVGPGEALNGGFGIVADGTKEARRKIKSVLHFDVNNGVARRSWAGNEGANFAIQRAMEEEPRLKITLATKADPDLVRRALGN
jgi:urocanate hydratase